MKLLGIGTSPKTIKSDKGGEYLTAILYLSPYDLNDAGKNVCPYASPGCAAACLNTSGRGQMSMIQKARRRKTNWFLMDREGFMEQLEKELFAFVKRCYKLEVKPAVRLNGTSDINWGKLLDMSLFPSVQFYDYTKSLYYVQKQQPSNYHLTLSRSEEDTTATLLKKLKYANVAIVFSGKFPKTYLGYPVVNGDKDDLRFADSSPDVRVIVGLSAKGKAKKDTSGFVVHGDEELQLELAYS